MSTLVIVVHVITCVFLILFVLLQAGKGAEVGAAFGGVSQTYFGTQGGNILTKITTVLAFVFMITSIGLTTIQHKQLSTSVMQGIAAEQTDNNANTNTNNNTNNAPAKK
ncbi:MAG: preprotein translocase subunit SecG [Pseudomonadota bacterium]